MGISFCLMGMGGRSARIPFASTRNRLPSRKLPFDVSSSVVVVDATLWMLVAYSLDSCLVSISEVLELEGGIEY